MLEVGQRDRADLPLVSSLLKDTLEKPYRCTSERLIELLHVTEEITDFFSFLPEISMNHYFNRLPILKSNKSSLPKPMNLLFAHVMSEVPSHSSFPFVLNSQEQVNSGNVFGCLVFLTVKTEPHRVLLSPLLCGISVRLVQHISFSHLHGLLDMYMP